MPIKTTKIQKDWFLITYDVKTSSNVTRDWMRNKIISMGGYMETYSNYLMPKSVRSIEEIQRWARDNDVNIIVYGLELTLERATELTQKYTIELSNQLQEINEQGEKLWNRLKEVEENLDDPDVSKLTGISNIVKSIRSQSADIMSTINRWGNEKDEFELEKLSSFVQRLSDRYERLREQKKTRVDEGIF